MAHTNAFTIEIRGRAAGIVVGQRRGFQFYATDWRFGSLDGRIFRSVAEAERAARRTLDRASHFSAATVTPLQSSPGGEPSRAAMRRS
jgi:hypothetical protein